MDQMIIQSSITLFEILCVIIVFATLFMRSRFFTEIFENRARWSTQLLLIIFFGLMSVFGTLSGLAVDGAMINIRDLGPMAAGLLCGPYVGLGAGIIGGVFRFMQGGQYMWTGLSAPLLSGILGGILYLANKRRFVPIWAAVLFIGLSETLISCYTLVLVTKPSDFLAVVINVAIPMVVFNIIGMFIFATVVHAILEERTGLAKVRLLELELESRRNLTAIINTIAYPVYVLDRDHRFTVVNDSMCRFFGRTRDAILGRTPGDFISEKDSAFLWDKTEDVFSRHATREDEVTITRFDGQVREIIITSAFYMEEISGQAFMVGVFQDITEKKKMQAALAKSEAWYRILFEHTGAATIIINEDSTIDQANTEFTQLTGYSREEIEGRMSWKDIAHPDDFERVIQYHHDRRINPAGVPTVYTVRINDRRGVTRTLHTLVAMIPGTRKSIASYIDISEQKRTEDALTLANRKLNLLSSITRHDIINQILILKGYLVMLKAKTDNPVLLDYIGRSNQAAHNIEHQITFTRDYQDMGVKTPSWYNVKSTIIGAKGALPTGNVIIEADLSDLELFVDPLFEKVFYNLIENSLQYGGAQLKTLRISMLVQGDHLLLTYEDDGVGITDADKEHLFERGFGKHTGFGLFLSREILAITGISIRETGTPGVGARFEILVPKGAWRFEGPA